MLKKWMSTAGVVALVVVALMAAALLVSCKKASSPSTPTATTTSGVTPNVSGGATGTQGQTTTSTLSATASAGGSESGTNGGGQASTTLTGLKPFPRLPESKLEARRVSSPVGKGEALAPLTDAPEPTISAMGLTKLPDGAVYRITLRPYGIGPENLFGSRLVVRVDSVKPVGSAPKLADIDDANLLVVVDTTRDGAITKGGTYTAVLTFRSDGTKLLPILSSAKAAN